MNESEWSAWLKRIVTDECNRDWNSARSLPDYRDGLVNGAWWTWNESKKEIDSITKKISALESEITELTAWQREGQLTIDELQKQLSAQSEKRGGREMTKEREALNAAIHWLSPEIRSDIFDDEHFERTKAEGVTYPEYIIAVETIREALKFCSNCGSDNVKGGYCITCSFRQ